MKNRIVEKELDQLAASIKERCDSNPRLASHLSQIGRLRGQYAGESYPANVRSIIKDIRNQARLAFFANRMHK